MREFCTRSSACQQVTLETNSKKELPPDKQAVITLFCDPGKLNS